MKDFPTAGQLLKLNWPVNRCVAGGLVGRGQMLIDEHLLFRETRVDLIRCQCTCLSELGDPLVSLSTCQELKHDGASALSVEAWDTMHCSTTVSIFISTFMALALSVSKCSKSSLYEIGTPLISFNIFLARILFYISYFIFQLLNG